MFRKQQQTQSYICLNCFGTPVSSSRVTVHTLPTLDYMTFSTLSIYEQLINCPSVLRTFFNCLTHYHVNIVQFYKLVTIASGVVTTAIPVLKTVSWAVVSSSQSTEYSGTNGVCGTHVWVSAACALWRSRCVGCLVCIIRVMTQTLHDTHPIVAHTFECALPCL